MMKAILDIEVTTMTDNSRSLLAVLLMIVALPGLGRAQPRDPVAELNNARRVYVPVEELEQVFQHDHQGVILPKAQFDALVARAKANSEKNPVPRGVAVVVTNADYVARVAGDHLLVTVTAALTQFEESWQETRFTLNRLSLEQALLDSVPAMVGRNSDGSVSLLTDMRGNHTLALQLSTELTSVGSDQLAAFSLLRAPSGSLKLSLPAGKRLLFGNLQLQRPGSLDQVADYSVAVGGLAGAQLRITDRAAENSADAMLFASTGYGLNVAPGAVTWHALTTLQIFGKPVDRLTFSVPRELEIADIESTGLESWQLSDDANDAGRTNISLTFGQAFDGARKISFKGVMPTHADQPWSVPPLGITNAASHIGQVIIQHAAGVRLRVEETMGVRRATVDQKTSAGMPGDSGKLNSEDPGDLNSVEKLRFDVWQPDFKLRLMTQPKQREVATAVAAVLDVNSTGLDLQAAITFETHFAPLLELDIQIPAEWQVLTVQHGDQPLEWQVVGLDLPGIHQLRILLKPPLAAEATGQIRLELRQDVEGWPVEAEPITVNLPSLFLPQSNLSEGAFVVRGDDNLDLAAFDLVGLDPQPLKADYERLRFQSRDTHFSGKLKITRKPSRISAQTVTVGRVDPQTIHAFMQMAVEVQGGGVRTLQIALPESAGSAVRFECSAPQIVEQKAVKVVNGERIWSVQFDQRLRGQALIVTDLELPRGDLREYVMPQPRFVDAERQTGFFAIEGSSEQKLSISATDVEGVALSESDPLDLPALYYAPKERIVAVYRTLAAGAVLKLSEQKFEKLPVATAICPRLEISTILGRMGELQHRATFDLKIVGVQGLHVTFPAQTTLWATLIDGQPVEVRRNGDVYLVPLTSGHLSAAQSESSAVSAERPIVLELFYRSDVPPVAQRGELIQEPPMLTVESGQQVALPVEVLEQKWNLFYPDEVQVVDCRGPLEAVQGLDKTGLLGRWTSRAQIPSLGKFVLDLFLVAVALGVFLFLTRGFRPTILMVTQFVLVVFIFGITSLLLTSSASRRGERLHSTGMSTFDGDAEFDRWGFKRNAQVPAARKNAPAVPQAPAGKPALGWGFEAGIAQKDLDQKKDRNLAFRAGDLQPDSDSDQDKAEANLGLLSLQIGFEPPAGSRERTFFYAGAETSATGIPLELSYVDRHSKQRMRTFIMALFGLFGWMLRRSDPLVKWRLATGGIVLPFVLLPVLPIAWQNLLDGCFFGTLIAIVIWLTCGTIKRCCRSFGWTSIPHRTSQIVASLALAMSLFAFTNSGFSEDKPTVAKSQPTAKEDAAAPVIVPYAPGNDPLASDHIFLSRDQFLSLYHLANPEKSFKQASPQNGGIIEAFYLAKTVPNPRNIDESVVEVTARYAVRSLVDGQFIIELPVGQVSAQTAKLDGQSAPLVSDAAGLRVAISKPGLHVLDFKFAVPAHLAGGTGSFVLPLKSVPAGKLSFEMPAKDVSIRVNGSTTIFRRTTQGESQSLELPVDKGGDISIAWQPKQAQGATAAVVHVDSLEAMTLTDAGAAVSHGFSYRIRQGGISDVTMGLPDSLKLQAVAGPDVGGWELKGAGDSRKLRVIFRRNVTDLTRLTVETFLDVKVNHAADVVTVPQIVPEEVTNEIGQIAIYSGSQFSVRTEQTESLIQVDSDKISTQIPVSHPNILPELAFRFSKRPYSLSLRINRLESLAHVVAHQASFISLHKQHLTTRLQYNLSGAPRSSLSVALPDDFVLLDVQTPGLRDWYLSKQEGRQSLTVELESPKIGQIELVIAGFTPRESADFPVVFPQPLDVARVDSSAAIWLDEGFTATIRSAEGWRSGDASQLNAELKTVRPDHSAQFAFTSTSVSPEPIHLTLTQSTPKIAANGLTMVTVTDVSVIYTLALQWRIDAAKTETLTLTTPKWMAGKLEFQGEGLREAVPSDAGDDRTRWTIYFRSPLSGKYFATATATLPPPSNQVQAPALVFENELKPIESQRQYLLLINSSLSQLTSTDPTVIESVQREDVPVVIKQEFVDQATELVRVKTLMSAPKWSVHRFPQQQMAPASVNVADLTTVLSRDGTYRAQAVYTIKNRSRQFLALKMPDGTELLSVFVNGEPSRAVSAKLASLNGSSAQLIALPKTSVASLSFPVKIVWRGSLGHALPKSANLRRREFEFPAPQILSQQQDSDYGIPVARTRWAIYVPDDLEAEASRSTSKHNMSLTDDTNQLYGKAALHEASELIGSLELMLNNENYGSSSRTNSRQIDVAASNLKQLGILLDNYHYDGSDQGDFNKNRQSVMKRLSEVEKLAGLELKKDQDAKTLAAASNGLGLGDDAVINREIAEKQMRDLNSGNGVQISTLEKSNDVKFNFGLNSKPDELSKAASKKETGSTAHGFKARIEGREALISTNDANIDALNSVVTSNSMNRAAQNQSLSGLQSQVGQQRLPASSAASPVAGQPKDQTRNTALQVDTVSDNQLYDARSNYFNDGVSEFWKNQLSFGTPQMKYHAEGDERERKTNPSTKSRQVNGPQSGMGIGGGMGGGMGGMGGGMAGGLGGAPVADAEGLALEQRGVNASRGPRVTQAGGLSLDIALPEVGHKLVFTKTGGDPKVSLIIQARQSEGSGGKFIWSATWAIIGIAIFWVLQKPDGPKMIWNQLPTAAVVIGILGFFVLDRGLSSLSFGLFLLGALLLTIKQRKQTATT